MRSRRPSVCLCTRRRVASTQQLRTAKHVERVVRGGDLGAHHRSEGLVPVIDGRPTPSVQPWVRSATIGSSHGHACPRALPGQVEDLDSPPQRPTISSSQRGRLGGQRGVEHRNSGRDTRRGCEDPPAQTGPNAKRWKHEGPRSQPGHSCRAQRSAEIAVLPAHRLLGRLRCLAAGSLPTGR